MSNIWTYSGEAGKALDATVRPFEVIAPRLVFPALGTDMLTWTVRLQELYPTTEIIPQQGQLVTLYRNGQRFFRGHALLAEQDDYTVTVQVAGPWHWLEKVPLSSKVSGSVERATMGFPMQNMKDSIEDLIDRMIALGIPIGKGTVANCFNCIPITLNQGSCAQALTELVRLIGDMAVWFDYSGTGHPLLNVTRRRQGITGSAPEVWLDAGNFTPGQFKCTPQDEMRVAQVRVPYIVRSADGSRLYQEQSAGSAELGHVLLLTASGEEIDTFLPKDKVESFAIQTVGTSGTSFKSWVMKRDSNLAAAAAAVGMSELPLNLGATVLTYAVNSSNLPTQSKRVEVAPTQFLDDKGAVVSTTGKSLLLTEALPDWLKELHTVTPVRVTGQLYFDFKETDYESGVAKKVYAVPNWWYGVQWSATDGAGFRGSPSLYSGYELFIHNFEIEAHLIDVSYPSLTTVYKKPDYVFIAPPSGFAQGLLDARNWTPHRGTCGWMEQECGGTRYLGKVINLTGASPSFQNMRAMVQSEELDLDSGATRLQLGPPARLDFDHLLDQTRTHSAQQVVYV
jgi:hypothetical protein